MTRIRLPGVAEAPLLELLDARDGGGDEHALRERARALPAAAAAPHRSRSYAFPYALVGWHRDRVGVDIERVVVCDEVFARSICTPLEEQRAPWGSDEEIISLWSGKEALAKALGDAVAYDPRRLTSPGMWEGEAEGRWRSARVPVPAGHCAWVCWRS